MRGSEATEIDVSLAGWEAFLGSRLYMPVQQIVAVEHFPRSVGEDEIIGLTKVLVAVPHAPESSENDAVLVEGTSRSPASVFTSSNSSS